MLAVTVGADRTARFWDVRAGHLMGSALQLQSDPAAVLFHHGVFYIAGAGGDLYALTVPGEAPRVVLRSNGWRFEGLAASGETVAAMGNLSLAVWRIGSEPARGLVSRNMVAEYAGFRGSGGFVIAGVEVKSIAGGPSGDLFSYVFEGAGVKKSVVAGAGLSIQRFGDAGLISDDGKVASVYDAAGLKRVGILPVRPLTASASGDLSRVAWCVGKERYQLFMAEAPTFRPKPLGGEGEGECGLMSWLPSAVAFEHSRTAIDLHPLNGGKPQVIAAAGADLDSLTVFAFDASGERVAVATNSEFELLRVLDGSRERKLPTAGLNLVRRMAFRSDGMQLAAADTEGHLVLLTFQAGDTRTMQLEGMHGAPVALMFSSNGLLLSALTEDGICGVYRTDTGVRAAKISHVAGTSDWVVETPDGRFDAPKAAWSRASRRSGESLVKLNEKPEGYTPGLLGRVLEGK